MKILFLDMDGVLSCPRICLMQKVLKDDEPAASFNMIDSYGLQYIKTICEQFNFKIVVSSAWRGNEAFRHMLSTHGLSYSHFHEDWKTYNNDSGRGAEIQDWLNNHPEVGLNYIIFEDEPFDLTDQQKENHLVQCDIDNGIVLSSIRQFDDRLKSLRLK